MEERIRWRAERGELPSTSTYYWEDAPIDYRQFEFQALGIPVIISISDERNFLIICTQGIFIKNDKEAVSLHYADIDDINSPPLKSSEKKAELNSLILVLKNNQLCVIKAEEGAAFFAVWNILLMLIRMHQADES